MISVIRNYTYCICKQFWLPPGPASRYKMQVSKMFTVNALKRHIFPSKKQILGDFKKISCNRNEPKQCIYTWQITEVSMAITEQNDAKFQRLKADPSRKAQTVSP